MSPSHAETRVALADLCARVLEDGDRGPDLEGAAETAHLLRSPRNAERLLTGLARAQRRPSTRSPLHPNPLEMTNGTWNRIALFLLGAAVGVGLYDVFSDSDGAGTAVLVLTSLGFLCVALGQRGGDGP